MGFGTLLTLDALASTQQTIAELGEDRTWASVDALFAAHNKIMMDAVEPLVERSTDRLRRYGGSASMTMDEVDELGTPDSQKITAGQNVFFPLRKFGRSLQWSRNYFLVATGEEFAKQVMGIMDADKLNITKQVKTALFRATNYTVLDRWVDFVSLDVKALVNADSMAIPPGPNGEAFTASSHTHYIFSAALDVAAMNAIITAITEHYNTGSVSIYINSAQEATVRALTGFVAYVDARIVQADNVARVENPSLNLMDTGNRAIGIFGAATIWVKPWIPSGYVFGFNPQAPKPLVLRTRAGQGNLQLEFDDESHPLRARGYFRELGLGAWNRTNGVCLQIAGSYTAPTF